MRYTIPLLAALAIASACTQNEGERSEATTARDSTVTVKGSDTLVLLTQRAAEKFMAAHPDKSVQVTGGGSGTGIAALINGTTDIATASRSMKESEKKQVQEKRGVPAVETPVALDGLAVYVHEKNPIPALSLSQLKGIFTGEITNWKELGGADAPIVLYGRENNSGTYAYFKEEVLEDEDFTPETQSLPGTAAVVNGVARDPNAIGYGGIAYGSGIRVVPVKTSDDAPAVKPSMANVTSGAYPISRKLFVYTAGPAEGTAGEFIEFVLSDEGQKVAADAGYYPLRDTDTPAPAADEAPKPSAAAAE